MRAYIFTTAVLLSLTALSKAEADFNPPPLTPETLDALQQGIRYGWVFSHEEMSPEQQKAYDLLIVDAHAPITTSEGQRDWLNPVSAIKQAAIMTPFDQAFSKSLNTFPTSALEALDPYNDFRQRLGKGIFVVILDRDSLKSHHYINILNNHQESPNFYNTIAEQSSLGALDKTFSVVTYRAQLPALDPEGNFVRLAKFMPEISTEKPTLWQRILEKIKTLNVIAFIVNADTPDAPYGAEE